MTSRFRFGSAPQSGHIGANEFRNHRPAMPRTYRMLGHERVAMTKGQLEQLVRDGILSPDTKVRQDGEAFATALRYRAEFGHLFAKPGAKSRRSPASPPNPRHRTPFQR